MFNRWDIRPDRHVLRTIHNKVTVRLEPLDPAHGAERRTALRPAKAQCYSA